MNKTRSTRVRTHYKATEDGGLVLVPGDPTRPQIVVGWIVWHSRELAGVLVPAGLAVVMSPWLWLVSGTVAAGWSVYEVWQAREQAAIKAGRDLPAAVDDTPANADVDTAAGVTDKPAVPELNVGAGAEVWL